jgi:succinate dehydrogenase / fumarate reductase membrane anchor subunit
MLIELLTKRYPGMRAWLSQRLSALVMAIYSVFAVTRFFIVQPDHYEAWVAFFQPFWWCLATLLFWMSLTLHAWLGIRDVFKDYVPNPTLRDVLDKLLVTSLWIYLIWAAWILLT